MNTPSWTPVAGAEDLWTIEKINKDGFSLRSTALRLGDGTSLVYGPLKRLPEEAHARLTSWARPGAFVAPNHFHNLGLPEHHERYGEAALAAAADGRPRLEKRLGLSFQGLDAIAARLPAGAELWACPGTRSGECWLRVDTPEGTAWCVGDGFFNVSRVPSGLAGVFVKLTNTGPGLSYGKTFTFLQLRDKRSYREWVLGRLESDPPRVFVPCHGDVLVADDLAPRLEALIRRNLS